MNQSNHDTSLLYLIKNDGMGSGETELRQKVLHTHLNLLLDSNMLLGAIAFYTEGVKLTTEDSPVLEPLQALESRGVHVIVCKSCLEHFGLLEQRRVGVVGGMNDVIAAIWAAKKVVTL